MRRAAVVVEVTPEYAVVEVSRKSACEGCGVKTAGEAVSSGCTACGLLTSNHETRAKAENSIGAEIGDRVMVETESSTVILYAAAVFLLPLLLGIAGYAVGSWIGTGTIQYVCSLIGFAAAFVFLYFVLNKRAEQRRDVRIVEIIGENNV